MGKSSYMLLHVHASTWWGYSDPTWAFGFEILWVWSVGSFGQGTGFALDALDFKPLSQVARKDAWPHFGAFALPRCTPAFTSSLYPSFPANNF